MKQRPYNYDVYHIVEGERVHIGTSDAPEALEAAKRVFETGRHGSFSDLALNNGSVIYEVMPSDGAAGTRITYGVSIDVVEIGDPEAKGKGKGKGAKTGE